MTSPSRVAAVWIVCLAGLAGSAHAQGDGEPLQLRGMAIGGMRTSVTEGWGTVYVTVANTSATAREARVVLFYQSQPDVQYGRDLWVPAGSAMTAWMPIGPAPPARSQIGRELEFLLFDRTGGQNRLVLPASDERVRSRALFYRSRTPTTALFVDLSPDDPSAISRVDTVQGEALVFAHVIRHVSGMPEHLSVVTDGYLPPTPEAFDGIDQIILAGNRLGHDPPGRAALRQWVQQGGRLLVMLDQAIRSHRRSSGTLTCGRSRELTTVVITTRDGWSRPRLGIRTAGRFRSRGSAAGMSLPYTVNGYRRRSFCQSVAGKSSSLTWSARWRSREGAEESFPYERRPDLPVARRWRTAAELRPIGPTAPSADDLRPLLTEEITHDREPADGRGDPGRIRAGPRRTRVRLAPRPPAGSRRLAGAGRGPRGGRPVHWFG